MNRQELIELLDAVDKINGQIYPQVTIVDRWKHEHTNYDVLLSVNYLPGQVVAVKVCNVCIWDSENDDREWIEKDYAANGKCIDAGYEPWEPYLRRKINKLVADIAKIKL